MTANSKSDLLPVDVRAWLKEFQGETDRAAAVLGVAYLDALLESGLRAFLVDDDKRVSRLLKSEGQLGTFSARALASYCLGLISEDQLRELRLLGRIRNRFAHELHGLSFANAKIEDLCQELRLPKLLPWAMGLPDAPRDIFSISVAILGAVLQARKGGARYRRREKLPDTQVQGTSVVDGNGA